MPARSDQNGTTGGTVADVAQGVSTARSSSYADFFGGLASGRIKFGDLSAEVIYNGDPDWTNLLFDLASERKAYCGNNCNTDTSLYESREAVTQTFVHILPILIAYASLTPTGAPNELLGTFRASSSASLLKGGRGSYEGAASVLPESSLVARVVGRLNLYPHVIDPRTGRNIPFPSDVLGRVPRAARVSWGGEERGAYIAEWYRRGYATPRGGWGNYDLHHIRPREFGGSNEFWNIVPVDRETHQLLFNDFWRTFSGL
jgi:hypothetical protein